jgi:SAM-dependent methyltransferase
LRDQSSEGLLSPFLQKKRFNAVKDHLKESVLDFGCGNGGLAKFCAPASYLGYDVDENIIRIARQRYRKYQFTTEMPKEMKFQTIVMLAIIEHIQDPKSLFIQLQELLEPDGRIVLTTPSPRFKWVHDLGARLGLFSIEASDEHEELINYHRMQEILSGSRLIIHKYKRFLLGTNQLFLLTKEESK